MGVHKDAVGRGRGAGALPRDPVPVSAMHRYRLQAFCCLLFNCETRKLHVMSVKTLLTQQSGVTNVTQKAVIIF